MHDRVSRLIHSLTPSEKRAFRIASRTHGEQQKAYVHLFDLIEGSPEGATIDLAKELEGIAAAESIPVLKSYLYRQLLRVIREHSSERSPGITVMLMIEEVRILHAKGLTEDASAHLQRAEAIAKRWEMHMPLQEIAGIASSLKAEQDDASSQLDSFEHRVRLHEERGELIHLDQLVGRLSAELHKGRAPADSEDRERYDMILAELPVEPPPFDAYRRRAAWHYARSTHAFGTSDVEGALKETEALIALFNAEKKRVDEAPNELIRQINNRLLLLHRLGRSEEFLTALEEARETLDGLISKRRQGDERTRLNALSTLWMREAIYAIEREMYERLVEISREIEEVGIEEVRQERSVFWTALFHLCTIGWTMTGDLRRALDWNTRTLEVPRTSRTEVRFAPICLQVILHHKLGNGDLVTSLLRRLPREVPTDQRFAGPAATMIELVRATIHLGKSTRSKNRLLKAIESVEENEREPTGNLIFGHTPFVEMVRQQADGTPG